MVYSHFPTPSIMRGLTADTIAIPAAANLPAVVRPLAAAPAPALYKGQIKANVKPRKLLNVNQSQN